MHAFLSYTMNPTRFIYYARVALHCRQLSITDQTNHNSLFFIHNSQNSSVAKKGNDHERGRTNFKRRLSIMRLLNQICDVDGSANPKTNETRVVAKRQNLWHCLCNLYRLRATQTCVLTLKSYCISQ